jgi:hypothetical protein
MDMKRIDARKRMALLTFVVAAGGIASCRTEDARPAGPAVTAGLSGLPADPDLKGYWSFDEGRGNTAANAVGPNAGKISDGLKWVDGKKGKALLFNGQDHVLIPHADYFNAPQFTFAVWIKLKNNQAYHYVAWKGGSVFPEDKPNRRLDMWGHAGGSVECILYDNKEGEVAIGSKSLVTDDRWHHVALTYDGKVLRLYIDGILEKIEPSASPLAVNEHPLWIGARPGGIAATGIIDEVRFYSRALSGQDVTALASEK